MALVPAPARIGTLLLTVLLLVVLATWAGAAPTAVRPVKEFAIQVAETEHELFLERLVEFAGDDPTLVRLQVEDGMPAMRILAFAEREGAVLIVVGTHGRTGLDRLLLGSVAEQVIQLANRPVVTVRPQAAPPPRAASHAAPCPVLTVGPLVLAPAA